MGAAGVNQPLKRVSPIRVPDEYRLPGRPQDASDDALDANRQTQFLLAGDLSLFAEAMNLQLRLMKDAYPSQYRTQHLAALAGLWSRVFRYLSDGLLLLMRGSYASCIPLVRAACEAMAAEEAIRGGETEEYDAWLDAALGPSVAHKAVDFEMGVFFSGSVLASDPVLGAIYRPASQLSRPNFGATLLQVAPESNNLRLALTFADSSFHLGWAELILGWLLALAMRQIKVALDASPLVPASDEVRTAASDLQQKADVLSGSDRCYIQEVDEAGFRRFLFHNFRRTAGGAGKKILL